MAEQGRADPGPERQAQIRIGREWSRPGLGMTAFLVSMDTPGIRRTARADSLGVRGLGCVNLDLDIRVPTESALGAGDQGFGLALWALEGGRIAIAAQVLTGG